MGRLLWFLLVFLIALSWAIALRMRAAVNELLTEPERIGPFLYGWRAWHLVELHRQYYPESKLRLALYAVLLAAAAMVLSMRFLVPRY